MKFLSSDWLVLSYFIKNNDRDGLFNLPREAFTAGARIVYEAIENISQINLPIVLEALHATNSDSEMLFEIESALRTSTTRDLNHTEIAEHIRAMLYAHGNRRIKQVLESAVFEMGDGGNRFRIAEKLIAELSAVSEQRNEKTVGQVLDGIKEEEIRLIPTNIKQFEAAGVSNWQMGNILALGGDTGTFKTTMAINMCLKAAAADEEVHIVYLMKEQPSIEVWHKVITMQTGLPYNEVQTRLNKSDLAFVDQVKREMMADNLIGRIHVVDQREFSTPYDVATIIRSYASKYSKIFWVLDYITCLDFGGDVSNYNANLAIGLRALKNVTLSTKSFGIVVCQFKDGWNMDRSTGAPRKMFPGRASIIWSSEIKNLSAYILLLYHPRTYFTGISPNILFTTFNKVRHSEVQSRQVFSVDGAHQSFSEVDMLTEQQAFAFMTSR